MTELKWKNYPLTCLPDKITGGFGADYGDGTPHRGTDVGVVVGTPVFAPAAGDVVSMTNDGSFGLTVCIEHDDTGWYSAYCHLHVQDVFPGDRVEAGQRIGLSGNTGYSSGPHLHWQVCDSPTFPVDIRHSRDPMAVPFEKDEDDEMKPEERSLLLLCASVLGGWTNGKPFDTVEEALPSFEAFEKQDQRALMGLGILNDCLNQIITAMTAHVTTTNNDTDVAAVMVHLSAAQEELRKLPEQVT